jgi:hypothetical protein
MVTVRGHLHAVSETRRDVEHEVSRRLLIARPNRVGHDDFGIGVKRSPGPHVAVAELPALVGGEVFCLRVAEGPDFVALDALRREVTDVLIVVASAHRAEIRQQLNHGVLRNARHADRGADGAAFNESRNHAYPISRGQLFHTDHVA